LAGHRLFYAGLIIFSLMALVRAAVMLPPRQQANDFAHYYVGSRLALEGKDPYTTALEPIYNEFGFAYEKDVPIATNPPPLLWLFAPFALLPVPAAFWAWVTVQLLALAAILLLTRQLLGNQLSTRGWWIAVMATSCSATVYYHLYYSQVQLVLAAMTLGASHMERRGHLASACGLATVAGLVKLYPLVLLPFFLWQGHKKGRSVTCLLVTAAVLLAGTWATGMGMWTGFREHALASVATCAINHSFNYTVPALVTNLGYAWHGFDTAPAVAQTWWWTGNVLGLVLIGGAYAWIFYNDSDEVGAYGLLCVAMLAGGLTSRGHYFVFLIMPLTAALTRAVGRKSPPWFYFLIAALVAMNLMGTWEGPWLDRHLVVKVLANNIPTAGMLALGVFWAYDLRSLNAARKGS
jgi:hypothetical protein